MYKRMLFYIVISMFSVIFCKPVAKNCNTKCCVNNLEVKNFQEYLRIDTSREENTGHAISFLERQASELGLPYSVYYPAGKPIFVMTWLGTNTSLPSIMLNSHLDVVPVEEKYWKYPPFSAHIDENCNIFGRGTQDTKSVTIQYLEAIRQLVRADIRLLRTLHIVIMPDEETGGFNGVKPFMKTAEFEALNVGFALDEGLTTPDEVIYATYQDKRPWQMKFTVIGESGHGSSMRNGSALEKMVKLINIVTKYREEQNEIVKQKDPWDYGSYTSVNINRVQGGVANNVVPTEMYAVIDMRLAVAANTADMAAMVESWRSAVGNDTKIEFIRHDLLSMATSLDSPYFQAMVQTARDIGITMKPVVCPAAADALAVRSARIPAIGFAPKTHTQNLVHANNEYLPVHVFLDGIDIYAAMLKSLGNLPAFDS